MQTVETVGLVAFAITLIFTCLGLPAQIWKNHVSRSVSGLSLSMMFMQICTFVSWVVYGILRKDWYIVGSNFPGAIFVLVILYQFWNYAKRPRVRS